MTAPPVGESDPGPEPQEPPTDTTVEDAPSRAVDQDLATAGRALLEEHRARMAAADEEEHRRVAESRSRLAARLQQLAASLPPVSPDDENAPLWDDMDDYQAQMRRAGWERSLREGLFDDIAQWTLDDLSAEGLGKHARVAAAWVASLGPAAKKLNLVIAGNVGAGKTSLAVAVGNACLARGRTVRIVGHEQYLTMLRPGQAPEGMTEALIRSRYRRHTEVLILDDLGAEMEAGASEHARKETVQLLGDRFNAGLPTVVTTNLSSEQVRQALGPRVYSRFAGDAHAIEVVGADHREPVSWG